jgi:hypothetical protein
MSAKKGNYEVNVENNSWPVKTKKIIQTEQLIQHRKIY